MILENSFGKEMMMAKIQCMAKVTEVSVLAEGIVSMWLSASGVAKSAKPGQFISLYCDNSDTLLPRPISLCEVNQKDGLLRIVFRIVGAGTKEFAAKKKDDEIRILGPLGNGFPLDAPLLELAKQLPCKTTVVVGYRNADAFLREELEEAADRVVIASDDGSIGIKGTVLDAMEAEGVTGDCIFSCGPTPMLRGVKQWAFEKQIPAWISMEEKMACGIGACLACVCESKEIDSHSKVKNKRICKDGPVFLSTDIEL